MCIARMMIHMPCIPVYHMCDDIHVCIDDVQVNHWYDNSEVMYTCIPQV